MEAKVGPSDLILQTVRYSACPPAGLMLSLIHCASPMCVAALNLTLISFQLNSVGISDLQWIDQMWTHVEVSLARVFRI